MSRRTLGLPHFALLLSIVAFMVSVVTYGSRLGTGDGGVTQTRASPVRVALSVVVATFSGQGVFAHRWYPTMMVVREEDAVELVVANPDEVSHQFELTGFNVETKVLGPGESARMTVVADRVGVFEYHCALPYDPARRHCTPDHSAMRGYLIVTK